MAITSTDVLVDGYQSLLGIANLGSVNIEIISINLPGINGGGEIDLTTMSNAAYRTRGSKSLKSMDTITATVAYSTDAYEDILGEVNTVQLFTITNPDTTTLALYGWMDTFVPSAYEEGSRPTATLTIVPGLRHSTTFAETAPAYTIPSGAT
jgi:hypothetical protein